MIIKKRHFKSFQFQKTNQTNTAIQNVFVSKAKISNDPHCGPREVPIRTTQV